VVAIGHQKEFRNGNVLANEEDKIDLRWKSKNSSNIVVQHLKVKC